LGKAQVEFRGMIRFILIGALILTLGLTGCEEEESTNDFSMEEGEVEVDPWEDVDPKETTRFDGEVVRQPDVSWEPYKVDREVRAVYFTEYTLSRGEEYFQSLIEKTNNSIINAWVINIKNDNANVVYRSQVPMVQEVEADISIIRDIDHVMNVLRENDIYAIGRIVAFKDKIAATARPDLAIKDVNGNVWRDNKGDAWLNPYNPEAWDYLVDIAKEAAMHGYKDIQFDYVRFPTDGRTSEIDYQGKDEEMLKSEAIAAFLDYARDELKPYGVFVTADIFGWSLVETGDASVGHHLETIVPSVDIILPMVYPSHYGPGIFGFAKPDLHPYEMVYQSIERAQERMGAMDEDRPLARIRPWLQDFTASYLGAGNWMHYGPEEVLTQIQATYDAGADEWVLWNSGNNYTWEALVDVEVEDFTDDD